MDIPAEILVPVLGLVLSAVTWVGYRFKRRVEYLEGVVECLPQLKEELTAYRSCPVNPCGGAEALERVRSHKQSGGPGWTTGGGESGRPAAGNMTI